MSKRNDLKDFLTDLADGIREKNGYSSTQKINPQDFRSEIESIKTGTDVKDTTAVANDVRAGKYFYLANGTKAQGLIPDYDNSFTGSGEIESNAD